MACTTSKQRTDKPGFTRQPSDNHSHGDGFVRNSGKLAQKVLTSRDSQSETFFAFDLRRPRAPSEFGLCKHTTWKAEVGTTLDTISWSAETVMFTRVEAGTSKAHTQKVKQVEAMETPEQRNDSNFSMP